MKQFFTDVEDDFFIKYAIKYTEKLAFYNLEHIEYQDKKKIRAREKQTSTRLNLPKIPLLKFENFKSGQLGWCGL